MSDDTFTLDEMEFFLRPGKKHGIGRAHGQRLAHIYPGLRFPNTSLCKQSKQPQWTKLDVFYWKFSPVCQKCLLGFRKLFVAYQSRG